VSRHRVPDPAGAPLADTPRVRPDYGVAFMVLVMLLAFGLRAGSLTTQSLWRDEVDALCYAFEFPHLTAQVLAPAAAGELTTPCACPPPPVTLGEEQRQEPPLRRLTRVLRPMIRQNGPLYFFLLRGWIGLAGHTVYSLRFFSLWFGVLGVPLTHALGRRLLGRAAGRLSALLVAASPYLVWYSQEVKMYTLVPALALLALYGLRRAVDGGGRRWWGVQVVATSLAFYTHIWSALLVPVQAVLLASWWPRWRRRLWGVLVSLALLTLPYLPLALWQIPSAFARRETGFPAYTLGEMALLLLNGWSLGITGRGWPWGAALCGGAALLGIVGAALTGVGAGLRPRPHGGGDRGGSPLRGLVGWLAVPLVAVWFVSLWQPLFTDRYLIWAAPAFYLLAGAGLAFLWRRGRWPAVLLLVGVLALFGVNLQAQATLPIKSDLRAAAAYVEARYRPADLLIFQIPHVRYTFDYYFGPEAYVWADGLYTNHRGADGTYLTTEGTAGLMLAQVTRGYRTVWLVASEVGMWDERGLVQGWLEANGERMEEAHFVRVDVYRYRLDDAPE